MKSVLISIQPKWCELIANDKKVFEIRKSRPKTEAPFKCYIYCTKRETIYLPRDIFGKEALNGKVIGEFICDRIEEYTNYSIEEQSGFIERRENLLRNACLTLRDWYNYIGTYTSDKGYGWHISDLVIYDKPKELGEFTTQCKYDITFTRNINCNSCAYYEHENETVGWCLCGGYKPLKRAFQSWGYVESIGE